MVLPLRHTRRGSGQPSGGCRMGGGSDFWELIGRKCKSAEDANNEDTLCTAPSDDPGASSAWAQRDALCPRMLPPRPVFDHKTGN